MDKTEIIINPNAPDDFWVSPSGSDVWCKVGHLKKLITENKWQQNTPDNQGYWWWWHDDLLEPIPVAIRHSITDNSYFAEIGQHGWNRAQDVSKMGGIWMRLTAPMPPELV